MNEGMAAIKKEPSIPVEIDGLMKDIYNIQELAKLLDGRLTIVLRGKIENPIEGKSDSIALKPRAPMYDQLNRMSFVCMEIQESLKDIIDRLEI